MKDRTSRDELAGIRALAQASPSSDLETLPTWPRAQPLIWRGSLLTSSVVCGEHATAVYTAKGQKRCIDNR